MNIVTLFSPCSFLLLRFSLSPKSSKRARARFQNHTRSQGMICKLAVMIIVNRDFGTNFSQFPPRDRSYCDSTSGAPHGMEGKNRLSERELSLIDFGMDVKCFRGIVRSCNSSAGVVRHCGDTCVFTYWVFVAHLKLILVRLKWMALCDKNRLILISRTNYLHDIFTPFRRFLVAWIRRKKLGLTSKSRKQESIMLKCLP